MKTKIINFISNFITILLGIALLGVFLICVYGFFFVGDVGLWDAIKDIMANGFRF